jgi:vancomycin permeability regulator SanA
MYIVILGGENDKKGSLSEFTKKRLDKFDEVYSSYRTNGEDPKVIISGGFRFSEMSHCSLVKEHLLAKYPRLNVEKEFIENDNTVDEAINMAEYFRNRSGLVVIITSDWHLERARYLFGKTFEGLSNIEIVCMATQENEEQREKDESVKIHELIHNSYGAWKEYLGK